MPFSIKYISPLKVSTTFSAQVPWYFVPLQNANTALPPLHVVFTTSFILTWGADTAREEIEN